MPVLIESDTLDIGSTDITRNRRELMVAIRNESFHFVKTFARQDFQGLADWYKDSKAQAEESLSENQWGPDAFKEIWETYRQEHEGPRFDRIGRDPKYIAAAAVEGDPDNWLVRQTLVDQDEHNDVHAKFRVNLPRCREAGRVYLEFLGFE